jgi:hypothetical protein
MGSFWAAAWVPGRLVLRVHTPWTLQAFGGVRSGCGSPGGSALRDRNQARRLISIPVEGFEAGRFLGTASLAPGVMTQSEQHRHTKLKARGGCL